MLLNWQHDRHCAKYTSSHLIFTTALDLVAINIPSYKWGNISGGRGENKGTPWSGWLRRLLVTSPRRTSVGSKPRTQIWDLRRLSLEAQGKGLSLFSTKRRKYLNTFLVIIALSFSYEFIHLHYSDIFASCLVFNQLIFKRFICWLNDRVSEKKKQRRRDRNVFHILWNININMHMHTHSPTYSPTCAHTRVRVL